MIHIVSGTTWENQTEVQSILKKHKSQTTINRGFSPAGTKDWALLKTPEEHMLRHSLLRPQMFLNSWFPHVAFPFSPCYCANYFSARSTWVARRLGRRERGPGFPLSCPRNTQHKGPLNIISPAVHHIGSPNTIDCFEMLMRAFFLVFAFTGKWDLCRTNFWGLRSQCRHSGKLIFTYTHKSWHYLLLKCVSLCNTLCIPPYSSVHCSPICWESCDIVLLIMWNFPDIHFSHFSNMVLNRCCLPWHDMEKGVCPFFVCVYIPVPYTNDTVRIRFVIHSLPGAATSLWPAWL